MSARLTSLALATMLASTGAARAQEVVPLTGGWSLHRRIGVVSSLQTVACGREVAYARSWSGDLSMWDGSSWHPVPRRGASMYGRTLAVSPDGRVFVEAGGKIARWDGSAWTDFALPSWQGDVGSGLAAPSADEVYYVGRGRIARFDGTAFATYGAGTWRDLSAVAVDASAILVGGQGGTIQRYDGHAWTREATGTNAWVRGIVAFAPADAWAWAEGQPHGESIVLHHDGRAWAVRDSGLTGRISGLGGSATRVYAATDDGVFRWNGTAWVVDIAKTALGEGYHSPTGLCATDRHLIVGDTGGSALVHAR